MANPSLSEAVERLQGLANCRAGDQELLNKVFWDARATFGDLRTILQSLSVEERVRSELEHFVDIIDGTENTGFDPHVEQMLMDAAESSRAVLDTMGMRQC
jgi:hypothetical protein